MKKSMIISFNILAALIFFNCADKEKEVDEMAASGIQEKMAKYITVPLTADLSALSEKEKMMIPLLIDAAKIMDDLFWLQAFGDKDTFLNSLKNPMEKKFAEINYGPWDRLDGNLPFIEGYNEKPLGANFYPKDMSKDEFDSFIGENPELAEDLKSLYTVIKPSDTDKLLAAPYSVEYAEKLKQASDLLRRASTFADDKGLRKYLELRADALITDNYYDSDIAWMEMKNNLIDVVIGPIESYEDRLFGYKAAFEAYILIKDKEWSERLAHFVELLPQLQKDLPVDEKYKREKPGLESDLNAYDAIYYAGDCNAGSKTIAINLPNDEKVQLKKGTRRLQLKNSMKAKFDKILTPISEVLIKAEQLNNINFNAFFNNVMFHEVAHGLGIKNTIIGKGTVRETLKEHYSAIEEGKADILGLYMITKLNEMGELKDIDLMDNYVTFLAGIFRSIRFGAASAHGRANLICFNFFKELKAFNRDPNSGVYSVDFEKMQTAVEELSRKILILQGDGNYEGTSEFFSKYLITDPELENDLKRLTVKGIPVDIVFEQGLNVLRDQLLF
jgi:hypothetical protein